MAEAAERPQARARPVGFPAPGAPCPETLRLLRTAARRLLISTVSPSLPRVETPLGIAQSRDAAVSPALLVVPFPSPPLPPGLGALGCYGPPPLPRGAPPTFWSTMEQASCLTWARSQAAGSRTYSRVSPICSWKETPAGPGRGAAGWMGSGAPAGEAQAGRDAIQAPAGSAALPAVSLARSLGPTRERLPGALRRLSGHRDASPRTPQQRPPRRTNFSRSSAPPPLLSPEEEVRGVTGRAANGEPRG